MQEACTHGRRCALTLPGTNHAAHLALALVLACVRSLGALTLPILICLRMHALDALFTSIPSLHLTSTLTQPRCMHSTPSL